MIFTILNERESALAPTIMSSNAMCAAYFFKYTINNVTKYFILKIILYKQLNFLVSMSSSIADPSISRSWTNIGNNEIAHF